MMEKRSPGRPPGLDYPDKILLRLPAGTIARIKNLKTQRSQAEFLRCVVLDALKTIEDESNEMALTNP